MSSSLFVRYNKSYIRTTGLIHHNDGKWDKFTHIVTFDRETLVVLWCARIPLIVLGKFMV